MGRFSGKAAGRLAAVLALVGLFGAGHVRAQVLEIEDDGSVVKYDRPTQFLAAGSQPIAPEPTQAVRAAGGRQAVPSAAAAQAIHTAAERHQVSERLVEAVAWQGSGFNPRAVSPKGARGTMQLMPQTARLLGVDADDEAGNIDGGADYLARMLRRFGGDTTKALAAYNAGPGAVQQYGGVPPYAETQGYVSKVLGYAETYRQTHQQSPTATGALP